MIYAIIDTNILVSSILTRNPQTSPTVGVVRCVTDGSIVPVYNDDIFNEYDDVLHRKKFLFPEEKVQKLLSLIRLKGVPCSRLHYEGALLDEKDRPFYEVSLAKDDSFLVTGNLKHFPFSPRVVSPAEMMDIMERIKK